MESFTASTLAGPPKEPTSDEKILNALHEAADPLGEDVNYLHKDELARITGLTASTLENRLTQLVKDSRIHRMPGNGQAVRGKYGPGPGN
jgi:DNA-binding HxlR family transcriptional regulator